MVDHRISSRLLLCIAGAILAVVLAACTPPPASNPTGDFAPTSDTTIPGGTVDLDSMTIPAGVTVTVQQDTVFNVSGDVSVAGTLTGDCIDLDLNVTADADITGLIDNSCPSGGAQDLFLLVDGALTLGSGGGSGPVITSDGNVDITDTATKDEPLDPLALTDDIAPTADAAAPAASAELEPTQGGPWNVNQAPAAGPGGRVRMTHDGDIDINVDITAKDGTDGADQTIAGTCDGSGEKGGNGGTLSIAARNGTLTIAANVTLTAGDGGKGGSCNAPSGCPATAIGGNGGRGGSVLVGGSNIVFGAGVKLVRGSGGAGGNATAVGDDGVGCKADGCDAVATGGKGGATGGIGFVLLLPGQITGDPSEDGGNGGRGGDASATAGKGGNCNDCTVADGGNGGNATATGGQGGNGASANIWTVAANSHKKGDGGDALAIGGDGGKGADCCKAQPGGNGGNGGNATATGGQIGTNGMNPGSRGAVTAGSKAGNGGDGGDGSTAGTGGAAGTGSGDPTAVPDGTPGTDGATCPLTIWFIYYSTIPDGTINPGTGFLLGTYTTSANTPPNPSDKTGEVNSTFLDAAALTALGFTTQQDPNYPMYQKSGAFVTVGADPTLGYAGFDVDLSTLSNFPVNELDLQFFSLSSGGGTVIVLGHAQDGTVINSVEKPVPPMTEFDSVRLPPPPPSSSEQVYSRITVIVDFTLQFEHWGVIIVDP